MTDVAIALAHDFEDMTVRTIASKTQQRYQRLWNMRRSN
jgi:hypothetical protein